MERFVLNYFFCFVRRDVVTCLIIHHNNNMIIFTRNPNSTCEHVSSMTDIDKYGYIFYNSPKSENLTNSDYNANL